MANPEELLSQVKSELNRDLKEPHSSSMLAKASRLTEAEWKRARETSDTLALHDAIWRLKLKALKAYSANPASRRSLFVWLGTLLVAAIGGGIGALYLGTVGNYRFTFGSHASDFVPLFMVGVFFGSTIVLVCYRALRARRLDIAFASVAGALLSVILTYGPGKRGLFYWLANQGLWRITVGMILGLLLFEIWQRRNTE